VGKVLGWKNWAIEMILAMINTLMLMSFDYGAEGSLMNTYSLVLSPNFTISSDRISTYLLESIFSPFNIVPFVASRSIR
jgi:hypothetical protein